MNEVVRSSLDLADRLLGEGLFLDAYKVSSAAPLELVDQSDLPSAFRIRLRALTGLGQWDEIVALGDSWLPRLRLLHAYEPLCRLHGHVGYSLVRLGRLPKAETHLRAAIHVATWDLSDVERALSHQRRLAILFKNLGRWQQAKFEILSAIGLADESGIA